MQQYQSVSSKKHILFISSWYPNKNNPTHGIFNRYFAEAAALSEQISVLHVSSVKNQANTFEFDYHNSDGINTLQVYYKKVNTRFPVLSHWLKYRRLIKAFDAGYQKIESLGGKPDLIHLNVAMPAGAGVLHLAQTYNLPYVVNENWSGYCPEDGNYKGIFLKFFTQKIIAGAKRILPTSEFLKEAMLSHGLNGKYEVVPNVVDVERFIPIQVATNKSTTRYLHISSLTNREKNVSGIIRAFNAALQTNSDIELVIVGDGDEKKDLELLANALGCAKKITFKGRLLKEQLVKELNACNCLVMFSHFETFCLVIIEAFACGKPVITSNAGAITAYMKPELGIMIEKGNEPQLTQALLNFITIEKSFDPSYIRNFAVNNYSYQKVNQLLHNIYSTVLKK